ncbi:MAG TPA: CPBP family intramembrane glutamic endopeptidase [Balneolales bacterium]|nr:CPBP family intramembrane glutamic endopeptidase [Balneolales bacterium]
MVKKLFQNPLVKIALLFALFFTVPIALSMVVGYQTIGGYLSPLLLLVLTWLLYRKEGKNLSELGINFKRRNIFFLPLGIVAGILFFCVLLYLQMLRNGIQIHINQNADYTLIFSSVFVLLQGVLNEELIFRGYCLKETMNRIGFMKANLIFGFFFIVWHWIAFNAWGNYLLMLSLVSTGFGHFLFAAALVKSETLYFPVGIHLGNNWAQRYLFSASMTGINAKPSHDILFILTSSGQHFSELHNATNYGLTIGSF